MVSQAKINKVLKKHNGMFIALEEMDRTGKLPRLGYKSRYNFTIDEALMREFRNYCKKKNIKMSAKVEELIKREVKPKVL